ncbi:transporter substrate-binding domain-containing protein [Burkholderiaceae bacterium DAT-1]|nr:transporter substrate-binding domain-containing protein [Burkholderiaceae bacterium DAT-1]
MKRIWAVLFCLALSAGCQASELRIAMEGMFPPFEEVDAKGNLRGFNVDLANALCERMKEKCKFERFGWNDLVPALNDKKTDVVLASMPITQDRKKQVDFTDPYALPPAHFIGKERRFPYVRIEPRHLEKMKIGVTQDTTYDRYLTARYEKGSTIVRYADGQKMYAALAAGELDAVLDDGVVAYYNFIQRGGGEKGFNLIGAPLVDHKYLGDGLGIAVKLGNTELREKLNKALKEVYESGEYKTIAQRYFVFPIYDR